MTDISHDARPTLTSALRRLEQRLDESTQPLSEKLGEVESRLRTLMRDSVKRPFTPHDFDHALDVEQYAAELCEFIPDASPLRNQPYNLYYLILAIWFHDSGMIPMAEGETAADIRNNHHLRIEPLMGKYFSDLFDQSEISLISAVARNHCEDTPALLPAKSVYQRTRRTSGQAANVAEYPRVYASILRIADICAITYTRTPWLLYQHYEMNPVSQKHWEAHLMIRSVGFASGRAGLPEVFVEFEYSSLSLRTFVEQHVKRIEDELRKCSAILAEAGLFLDERVDIRCEEKRLGAVKEFTVLPRGLYQLLVRGLYGRADIFMRELVQNGLDAITRQQASTGSCVPAQIDVTVTYEGMRRPENVRQIQFRDYGIGMDQGDIDSYVLQITAKSIDDPEIRDELRAAHLELIAEWGIGFLSVFAVTDRVVVRSHKTRMRPVRVEFGPLGSVEGKQATLSDIRARASEDSSASEPIARGTEISVILPTGLDFDPLQRLRFYLRYPTTLINYVELCADGQSCILEPRKPEPTPTRSVAVTGEPIRGGWIAFDPEQPLQGIEIAQAGVLVEEHAMDLLPSSIRGVGGVIDCETKFLPLAAARNEAVRESSEWRELQSLLIAAVPKAVGEFLRRSRYVINEAFPKSVWETIETIMKATETPEDVKQGLLEAVERSCFIQLHNTDLVLLKDLPKRLKKTGEKKVYLYSVGVDADQALFAHEHKRVEHVTIWIPHQSVVSLEEQRLAKAKKCLVRITPFFRSSGAGGQYHNHHLLVKLFAKQGIEIDESLLREGRERSAVGPTDTPDLLSEITGIKDWAVSDENTRAQCVGYWAGAFHFELNRERPVVKALLRLWEDEPDHKRLAQLLLKCYSESLRVDPERVVKAIEEFVSKL